MALCTCCNSPQPIQAAESSHEEKPKDDIFAGTNVLKIRILIPNSGISALRNSGWGNGQERPKVKAIVREGGVVYTNVEVHLKGAAGSFRPIDDNPALTLNFDKLASGQSFHGYHKISLNNSVQDRSYLTEKVCRELFEAAGVPAPHAGFATVELNGRDLGLRVMVEGWGKHFLKRYFDNTSGNLYDGGFVQDVNDRLSVNSGDNPQDHSGLLALISALREQDPTRKFARLEETLDMDRFLSYLAMDVMQCDWDGYAMNHNNWRLFHDKGANKMVFMPHGLDQMFGVERTTPECRILPRMQGRVASAVISNPEGKRRYLERMSQLYTNVWHVEAILKRVDQLAAVIRPAIVESAGPSVARYHDREVNFLKERITQRDESLRQQLATLSTPPSVAVRGSLQLSGWTRRTQTGQPEFRHEKSAEADDALYLAAKGNTICSWRTKAMLEEGAYRFEGRIKTKDIRPSSGEPSGGAGLRISGNAVAVELTGTQDWQKFAYPFRVPEGGSEIEAVCELRASRGEAWFDTASLRLVRLR
ncbi:MAG TPA: CotH kinase family protein [Verrucomicrobiae bacterium]|nr:CotH kinase family protein [Verrucomicrobiae bacterium]